VGADDRLNFNASGTYLTEYMAAVSPAAPLVDRKNTIFNPLQFKARAAVTWDHGPLSARLAVTHIGGYDNTLATPVQKVESFNPVDLGLTWKIGDVSSSGALKKGMSFGIEVRNLLDEKPPFVFIAPNGNGSGGYDATASDPIGRFFAASVRAKF
jgi:iron complex outermembrane receptor protein